MACTDIQLILFSGRNLMMSFGKESRNIRLGLATDGMNLFGNEYKSQFMTCFTTYLQLTSWIVHEVKIHDVVYDDIRSEIARE